MHQINPREKWWGWNPAIPIQNIVRQSSLFSMLFWNDLRAKFRHSVLGFFWLFIPPLCILLIYVYIFSIIFKVRWEESAVTSRWGFGLVIYSGITVYSAFSDSIMGSLHLLTARAGMLKRVPFPYDLLPISLVCSNMLISSIVLWILFGLSRLTGGGGSLSALLYFPLIYLPFVLMTIGCCWITSSLGVFFKDLGNLIGILLLLLFFSSPVFYSAKNVPGAFNWVLKLNPLSSIISNIRCIFLQDTAPNLRSIFISWCVGIVIFHLGYRFFLQMRRRFADAV